jgi:hypothetical protein
LHRLTIHGIEPLKALGQTNLAEIGCALGSTRLGQIGMLLSPGHDLLIDCKLLLLSRRKLLDDSVIVMGAAGK